MMASQMGKTAGLLNVMGQRLDDAPVPMLYVGPTKSNVDRVIEPQIVSMLRSSQTLWSKTDRSRKAQKLAKTVNGVSLRLAWAGSPTELASQPAHTVLVDEIDRMEPIPGEGDPVSLAEARTTNYAGGRIIITSTPTEGNVDVDTHPVTGVQHWKVTDAKDVISPVWRLFQEGTRHEWAVPCPHCGEYFVPRLRLLTWPEKATPKVAKREARLTCPSCGSLIEDSHKSAMNSAGHFLAPGQQVISGRVVGEAPESDTASFWVSGLMSPWKTFGDRAADYVRALASGDQERLRVVVNTGFGELYAFRGEAPPAAAVRECVAPYHLGQIPAAVKLITCGVDVQKARLVYAVRGWGHNMESWLLDYGEIHGQTAEGPVWNELSDLLEREYVREDGAKGLRIRRMGIDSGYRPGDKWRKPDNLVYEFCLRNRRALPTKGRDTLNKPLKPSLIDVTFRGQVYKQGLQLWHLDSDYFKSWVQGALLVAETQQRRWWVPQDVSEDYCMQLTAETRVPKPSGLAVWVKIRQENHFLDCEAINVAMAQSLGLHRKVQTSIQSVPNSSEPTASGATAEPPPSQPSQPPRSPIQGWGSAPVRRRNWTTTW